MNPFSIEAITLLGAVMWKIATGLIFPMIGLYLFGLGAVWLLKKGGIIDL